MADMIVPPSISLVSFNCPHCGAHAQQNWMNAFGEFIQGIPAQPARNSTELLMSAIQEHNARTGLPAPPAHLSARDLFTTQHAPTRGMAKRIGNLQISKCFACKKLSVWVSNGVIYPAAKLGPAPNPDLPPDILHDYEEAQTILNLSPRGAAALLRLAIQKLCVHLGEKGKSIDADIAALVKKGLNARVKQALDIVRVIGNEAVHPGELDLRDDQATASKLFGLVNLIAEKMISEPKHVEELYVGLPSGKREAIENRDKKKD